MRWQSALVALALVAVAISQKPDLGEDHEAWEEVESFDIQSQDSGVGLDDVGLGQNFASEGLHLDESPEVDEEDFEDGEEASTSTENVEKDDSADSLASLGLGQQASDDIEETAQCAYSSAPSETITGNKNQRFTCVKIKRSDLVDPSYARYAPDKKDNTMTVKTACAFERMKVAASRANVHLKIASGFRTLARQTYFWNCYQTKKCNNGNLAARPGTSNHGLGIALDLNTKSPGVYEWLRKEASSFGFVRTVKTEKWHWEFREGARCSAFVKYPCTDKHLPDTSCTAQKGKCIAKSQCRGKTLQGKVCNGWFCCPGQTFCCIQGGSANPAPPPPRRKAPTPPPRSTGGAAPGAAGCSYAKQPSELITGNNNRKFPCVKIKSSDLVNPAYARYAPDKKDNTMVVKTACAFERMKDAATAANVHLKIASGFRTLARQQYFWNCYQTKKCNNGNLAARPGTSNHGLGIALDLNTKSPGVYEWLRKEASSFGFVRTVKTEKWHWEYRKGAKCSAFVNYRCTDTHLPDTSCTAQKGKCMAPSKCKGKTLQGKVCNGWFCCPGKTLCCIGGSSVKAQAAGGKKNAMKQVTQPLFIGKKVVPKAPKTQQMPKGSKCPGQGCKGPIKARPMGAGTGKKPAVTKKGTSKARKEITQAKVVAASAERAAQRAAKTTRKQGQRTRDNARTTARKTRATARTAGRRERKVVRRAGRRAMKAVRKSWKKNKHTVRHQGRRARGIARRRSRAIKKQDRRLARGHRHATRRDTRRVKGNIKAGRRSARRNARRIGRRIRKIRLKMRHRRERNQLRRGKRRFQLATRRITKLMRRQSENNRLRRVRRKERKNQKKLRVSLRTKQANREQRRFFKQLRHLERRDAKKNTAAAKLRSVRNQIRRVANRNHKTRERFRRMRFKQRASWRRNRQRRSMRRFRRRTNRRAHRKNVFRRTFKRIGTAVRSAVARGRRAVQRFRTKIASSMRNHAKRLVARHRAHRARIALRHAARRKRAAARLARVRKTVARGFKTARRVARRWAHRAVSRTQRARKRVRARHHAHRARHRARRLALRARTLARRTRRRVAHRMRVRARVARVRRGMTRMRKTMQRAGKAARKRAQRIRQRWRGVTRRARQARRRFGQRARRRWSRAKKRTLAMQRRGQQRASRALQRFGKSAQRFSARFQKLKQRANKSKTMGMLRNLKKRITRNAKRVRRRATRVAKRVRTRFSRMGKRMSGRLSRMGNR